MGEITYTETPARADWARRESLGGIAVWCLALVLIGAWVVLLRPPALGGSTSYIVVSGVSMEPSLRSGDLVIARTKSTYETGDVVAYRVAQSDSGPGDIVIHRIVGGDASIGYVLQGDNRRQPDRWHPRDADIVGAQIVRLPKAGAVVSTLKRPAVLLVLVAAVLALVLTRRRRAAAHTPASPAGSLAGVATLGSHVRFVPTPQGYALAVADGEPPEIGDEVLSDGRRYVVARLGHSPLPQDERQCAFLEAA